MFDLDSAREFYNSYAKKISEVRNIVNRPLTYCEKILYAHLYDYSKVRDFIRGEDYVDFKPDRVAMQDATAQMALLQFMNSGRNRTAVAASVHCDHLIEAFKGVSEDLPRAMKENKEVYDFLSSVSSKYGIGFWKPGAGIIHQVVLENYAMPGAMMLGTDSHTPNAGGLGMIAIGVGGADAVDVMTDMAWELKMPKVIGVRLTGKLSGWCSPKDVILKLAGILTVKGGTNSIIEYFGEGASTLPATGKATICNMGAEVGATTSLFAFDNKMKKYLIATGREGVSIAANEVAEYLRSDDEVYSDPEKYYDRVIHIDLSSIEPYINGPFTPDLACPISEFAMVAAEKGYPQKMDVGLIGSCTNSSYNDISRAASVARQAIEKGIKVKSQFIVNPGSVQVFETAKRDGLIADFEAIGGVVMANACGPCIGQWHRITDDNMRKNSIVTSFNRNFAKRADGNPNTYAFIASPEIVTAMTLAGSICFNPLTDKIINDKGEAVILDQPQGDKLPKNDFVECDKGYVAPGENPLTIEVVIDNGSSRIQKLEPFTAWDGKDFTNLPLLIKTKGKCTTDHISMAGKWLQYRGHLENISDNLLMGAVNAFNDNTNDVICQVDGSRNAVSAVAKMYKENGMGSVVVSEDNYGEGSSREHAAMEPRFLGVRAVLAKSFARIHETNLKKQGLLAITFVDSGDYDKVRENDKISVVGLTMFEPGVPLKVILTHDDGSVESFNVCHTYNKQQIEWFKAGAALNIKNNI